MLVLTRRKGEALLLDGQIEVRVLRVDGDQVRLGIIAPKNVPVVRAELLVEIARETESATAADPAAIRDLAGRLRPQPEPAAP